VLADARQLSGHRCISSFIVFFTKDKTLVIQHKKAFSLLFFQGFPYQLHEVSIKKQDCSMVVLLFDGL